MFRLVRSPLLAALLTLTIAGLGLANTPPSSSTAAKPASTTTHHKSQKELMAEAKVAEKDARATAQAQVPTGKFKSYELEKENGKLIYSYKFTVPKMSGFTEVNVDAMDGSVVNTEHEGTKAESKSSAPKSTSKSTPKSGTSPAPHR